MFYKSPLMMGRTGDVLCETDPGCRPLPNMLVGFIHARALAAVGVPCFGFASAWLPPEIPVPSQFHAHDERTPVHGFHWGLAALLELSTRYCTKLGPA